MTWPTQEPSAEPGYTLPPPTAAPLTRDVDSPYYPSDYPTDPWSSLYQPAPPRTVWPAFKRVVTLGWFVVALIAVVIVTDVFEIIAWVRDYRLVDDLQSGFGSASIDEIIDRIHALDDFRQATRFASVTAVVACGIVFIVWFYRVRWNAEAYGTHEQRRGQGWAIGSWICPFIALFYPYQMTNDALIASEAEPGTDERYLMSVPVVTAWWTAWLLDNALGWVARFGGASINSFGDQQTVDVIRIVSSVADIAAAVLFIVVVLRLNRAQGRWPGKVRAIGPTR